jgi:hypothetical protein
MSEPTEIIYFSELEKEGFRNESEREFLTALFRHAPEWASLGVTSECCMISYWDQVLMIAFDICDWSENIVLRSLKIDYTGARVLAGETGSNLFDIKFEPDSPGVTEYGYGASPEQLAYHAAKWLYEEMSRPIVLREWKRGSDHHRWYQLADTGQQISWSDSQNEKLRNLGAPTKEKIVHPINQKISSD